MVQWWEAFFQGLWQGVQVGSWSDDDNRESADRVERAVDLAQGSRVLDVPCGGGRIALELASRGHDATGVDITEEFLAVARREAEARGVAARFELGDMRELPYEAEFDAVVNFGGSFGYFDDDDNARVVAAAHRALRPGGRFLIDAATVETIFPGFQQQTWNEAAGTLVLRENRFDHRTGRLETDWILTGSNGARETSHSSMRLYTYRELELLLREHGFVDVSGFDAMSLEPFGLGSSRLLVVGTKPG